MRGLSNEQLREKVKSIFQEIEEKLKSETVSLIKKHMLDVRKNYDYYTDNIMQLFASQRQAIIKEVREGVIGNDHMHQLPDTVGSPHYTDEDFYQNQLRAEQRIKLDAIEKKYNS